MRRWVFLGLCLLIFAMAVGLSSLAQEIVPAKIPQQAFAALAKARQWRQDAILVMVEVNDYSGAGNFTTKFSFYSAGDGTGLWVIASGPGSSMVSEAGGVNWGTQTIPALFLDLPAAVQRARALGMRGKVDHAMLRVTRAGLNWEITPVSDPDLRVFTINASLSGTSSSQPFESPQLPQPAQLPQPVSDWLIVPGQRIGPVWLGMIPASALKALGQRSQKCAIDVLHGGTSATLGQAVILGDTAGSPNPPIDGFDPGGTSCNVERWGLFIFFEGEPNSALGDRRVDRIEASVKEGDVSRKYATERGIRIGSSDQDVRRAYGYAEMKKGDFENFKMTYEGLGIEFTFGGTGRGAEQLPKNIVEEIAVSKPRPYRVTLTPSN
ncbi:MAG: hypothetical protein WCA91_03595 [Candidatus Acidiferrales bacterium]